MLQTTPPPKKKILKTSLLPCTPTKNKNPKKKTPKTEQDKHIKKPIKPPKIERTHMEVTEVRQLSRVHVTFNVFDCFQGLYKQSF